MSILHHLLLALVVLSIRAEDSDPLGHYCNEQTKINTTISVVSQIRSFLTDLNTSSFDGHVEKSYASSSVKLYGLAQCRRDVSIQDCRGCISRAAREVQRQCPEEADARIWYDNCFLRYSPNYFLGEVDTTVGVFYWNVGNVTQPLSFSTKLGFLMDRVRPQAAASGNQGLGRGQAKVSDLATLYALAQCTEDLSGLECEQCVSVAVGQFGVYCKDRKGCRVLYSSCYVRYELYPFFYGKSLSNSPNARRL